MPTVLTDISSRAWEHPADRAALNTLRALPMFDEVVRRIAGFFGDRGIRQLFLANAVRVGPKQRPKLDQLYTEVLTTLDWPTGADRPGLPSRPELYVTQTPFANAAAVGFDRPFIVLNTGTLGLLKEDEERFIIAHELGHIMSGHVTYTTIAIILMTVGVRNLPFLAGLAILPFQLALLEWYRKAELSSDRAGLLGTQDPQAAMRTFLKMAGGGAGDDEIDLDAFMVQASEYEAGGDAWDNVLKLLNTAFRDHPFNTVRAAELQRWIQAGDYDRILRGEYPKRGPDGDRPLGDDYADAAGYYGQQTRDVLGGIFDRARDAFNQARGSGTSGSGTK
ncbi:MAG TPA: M48 family metallopeptidase [Gemmatimonadaceae bacterium]|nr:M48 family metallopeptidase [Gemmatimonadaceae bacterium]